MCSTDVLCWCALLMCPTGRTLFVICCRSCNAFPYRKQPGVIVTCQTVGCCDQDVNLDLGWTIWGGSPTSKRPTGIPRFPANIPGLYLAGYRVCLNGHASQRRTSADQASSAAEREQQWQTQLDELQPAACREMRTVRHLPIFGTV